MIQAVSADGENPHSGFAFHLFQGHFSCGTCLNTILKCLFLRGLLWHSADAMLADKAVEFLVDANVFSCFLRDINGKVGLLV